MLAVPCEYRYGMHVIVHPPCEKWAKKCVPSGLRGDIFVYFQTLERNFVVAQWMSKGSFLDLLNLGHTPAFSTDHAIRLRRRFFDSYRGLDMARDIKAGLRQQQLDLQAENDETVDRREQATSNKVIVNY